MVVLDEIHDQEAAVILWQMLQDVTLWASLPPPQRRDLFNDEAGDTKGSVEGLDVSLSTLNHMVHDPEVASEEVVCRLCLRIADWAEERRALGTALAFVEAAAKVDPKSADYAYRAGKLARRKAEYARAEVWLRRAITLARRSKDRKSHALALSGLGNLYWRKGNIPTAVEFHMRSLKMARRYGLRDLHADGLYALCILAFEMHDARGGNRYALQALQAYGPGNPKLPSLAHDVARFWIEESHAYERSLSIFRELLRHIWEPAARLCVITNMAFAAGGAGLHDLFQQAWRDAWSVMERMPDAEGHASAMLHLAYGAACLAEWEHARCAAEIARDMAAERQEAKVRADAEAILNAMEQRDQAQERIRTILPDSSIEPDPEADELATELLRALRAAATI